MLQMQLFKSIKVDGHFIAQLQDCTSFHLCRTLAYSSQVQRTWLLLDIVHQVNVWYCIHIMRHEWHFPSHFHQPNCWWDAVRSQIYLSYAVVRCGWEVVQALLMLQEGLISFSALSGTFHLAARLTQHVSPQQNEPCWGTVGSALWLSIPHELV